jgi:hypothetical protein
MDPVGVGYSGETAAWLRHICIVVCTANKKTLPNIKIITNANPLRIKDPTDSESDISLV